MATEITMPALSPSMTEGNLARWLKQEGDTVEAGEVLLEIETDKALVEFEAPAAGTLAGIRVPAGSQNVKVGATLAWLLQAGEAAPAGAAGAGAAPAAFAATAATAAPAASTAAAGTPGHAAAPGPAVGERIASSPLARRLARQHGLSLAAIRGSGPRGRIVQVDIEAALSVAGAGPARAAGQIAAIAPPTAITPAATVLAPDAGQARGYEDTPHTNMRRAIARRLSESKQQAPHFYLTIDCQIDALLALRAQVNAAQEESKVSVNDLIVRAVAVALKRVPAANASWTDNAIRRWKDVDLSIAVATPAGLITPVLRQADTKSLGALSAELRELAGRAREGRLKPAEYEGGGFSISNLGMFGVREFAAILNPPQACILAVGAGEPRPVVHDGALAIATVMTCTLSVDHRVVDGAVGAEFLAAFKGLIEQPLAMLV
ncbi:MAG TPA: pyruvate dehydrogenase complex dihydrolipoamide acetyltransferase [Rubrivivax sp.]|nr:pyruvate dehydrogenase complex dihydrolipoamide acetyltransferase [Rubrivivax sp.]